MGQGSSAQPDFDAGGGTRGGSTSRETSGAVKTCYYELLAVARDATQDEYVGLGSVFTALALIKSFCSIKKAYKKKALELHPDRNYNDAERATELFMEVQGAYEVLSDPQERAWYDSHREAILRNDNSPGSGDAPSRPTNVTTSEDIIRWFSLLTSRLSYDDSNPKSFYAVLGKAFSKLAEEETAAAEWENEDATHYPDFGNSKSGHEDWVKNFYAVWGNFRTVKTFSWCDVYRYSDAPDRRIKRILEKENKKLRDAAIREFNDTVRVCYPRHKSERPRKLTRKPQSFVMFVRKRDPRFISNTQTEAQRQAALLAASKEQAARQRAENAAKLRNYKAADWTQVSEETAEEFYDSEETEAENGSDAAEEEEEEEEAAIERYECIVCKKTFGSEGQMDAHERSKKHTKAVYVLKRQMEKENKEFDLDRDVRGWAKSKAEFTAIDDDEEPETEDKDDEEVEELEVENKPLPKSSSPPSTPSDDNDDDEGDEYVTQQQFEARVLGSLPNTEDLGESLSNTLNLTNDNESLKSQPTKVGKAKAKRAKKAAAETDIADATTCVTCKQSFPSNSKMFNHLRDNPSHAKPVATTGGGKKGKGKGKRK